MAMTAPQGWLIAYDITNKKRLGRLGRFIKKHAIPVQFSLYWFEGSPARMGVLMREIAGFIDPDEDDVRAYALPKDLRYDVLGRGSLPGGVGIQSALFPELEGLLLPAPPVGYDVG
jgi:CRISPR-associated protein Cas2